MAAPNSALLVGVRILPHRVSDVQNFLLDISDASHDAQHGGELSGSMVKSNHPPQAEGYTFVKRALHKSSDRYVKRDERGWILSYGTYTWTAQTVIELASTLVAERARFPRCLQIRPRRHPLDG